MRVDSCDFSVQDISREENSIFAVICHCYRAFLVTLRQLTKGTHIATALSENINVMECGNKFIYRAMQVRLWYRINYSMFVSLLHLDQSKNTHTLKHAHTYSHTQSWLYIGYNFIATKYEVWTLLSDQLLKRSKSPRALQLLVLGIYILYNDMLDTYISKKPFQLMKMLSPQILALTKKYIKTVGSCLWCGNLMYFFVPMGNVS